MPVLKRKIISIDTECTGLDLRHGAKPFFVTVCQDPCKPPIYWEAHVNPLTRQPLWETSDLIEIEKEITEADFVITQNAKFDVKALWTIGIDGDWPWHKTHDTLLQAHLLCSNQPKDLTTLALIYLRKNIKPFEDKLEAAVKEARKIAKSKYPHWRLASRDDPEMPSAKDKTWKYDSWLPRAIAKAEGYSQDHDWWTVLADYSNADSIATLAVFNRMKDLLEEKDLTSIYKERLKLLPVIFAMESVGMTMSKDRTEETYERMLLEADEYRRICLEAADHEIEELPVNGMSNDLRYVLFEKFGLQSTKKTKAGKQSGDKFVLDHWIATLNPDSSQWKFVNALRNYRRRKTALGYLDSYEKFWLPHESGCMVVYPSFNATGTDTLRFSSQNPNAQQVSKQQDVNLRYCFGPAPGREWWAVDYSNLELRIPAYESGEDEMVKLFEHPDDPPYYGSYHMMIFDTLHPDKFAKHGMDCKKIYESTWYQWTKNGDFAVQYGAVESSGTADRAYHVPGAQRRIMSRFTKIKELSRKWIEFANKTGYVETVPDVTVNPYKGYPLFCTRTSYGRVLETVPLSYHVQGTAMWITMKAMIRCHKYLTSKPVIDSDGHIVCQVHDEMIFDFPVGIGKHHIGTLRTLMEMSGDDVGIPLGTTVSYHPNNWAEAA